MQNLEKSSRSLASLTARLLTVISFILLFCLTGCGSNKTKEEFLAAMPETGTLNISMMSYDSDILTAKKMFETKYPGWTVEPTLYNPISYDKSGMEIIDYSVYEKYETEISLQLMSGLGPDIIDIPYHLPIDKLQRSNALEDLYPYLNADEDINMEQLMPNILKGTEYNGKLYYMPFSFFVECIRPNFDLDIPIDVGDSVPWQWTWEEAAAYFQPYLDDYDIKYLIGLKPQSLTATCVRNYYSYLVDKEKAVCNFKDPIFTETLKSVKSLYDKGLLPDADETEFRDKSLMIYSIIVTSVIDDFKNLSGSYIVDDQYFAFPTVQGVSGHAYKVGLSCAMNSNSKQKTAAWEFLKILLSDELQVVELSISPINLAVVKSSYTTLFNKLGKEISEEELNVFLNDRADFLAGINRLSTAERDDDFMEIIEETTKDFFTGGATLEETVENTQNKMQRYLNELK